MEFKSDAFEAIYEAAKGLHQIGVIDDTEMVYFDEKCLVDEDKPVETNGELKSN